MPKFFLQNSGDWITHFDYDYEVDQWTAEGGATITTFRYQEDADHPACMRVISDTDGKGVYYELTVNSGVKYAVEFAYKNAASQEIDYVIYDQTNGANIETGTLHKTIWSNLYTEVTIPATCTTVRIFLRAGTANDVAFYVDDVLMQGNVIAFDPEHLTGGYRVSYPFTSNMHTMEDGSNVVDRKAPHFRANLEFTRLSPSEFTRILDFARSGKIGYFDDGDIPQMTDCATLYDETGYNFTGISNGSATHVATYATDNDLPNDEDDFDTDGTPAGTEFSTANYNVLDDDDGNSVDTSVTSIGHHGYHKFRFNVTEYGAVDKIQSIAITYKGTGNDSSGYSNDGLVLMAWNGTNWVKIAESITKDKQTLAFTFTKPEQAQDFVDVSNGYIYLLVRTRGIKTASYALTLKSYYVEVTVNENLDLTIELSNKAVLDSGDVVSVKNLTQGTTLTLTTHYTIGDARDTIILDSGAVTGGDSVEVKYDQYHPVRCANAIPEERYPGPDPADIGRRVALVLESVKGLK